MDWRLGGTITGAVAVAYGLLVAFGTGGMSPQARSRVVMTGAMVVLACAVLLFLLPLMEVY